VISVTIHGWTFTSNCCVDMVTYNVQFLWATMYNMNCKKLTEEI